MKIDIRSSRRVDKPWGYEEIWAENDKYVGKILFIKDGEELSLQHHEFKDETIYVLEGSLLVYLMEKPEDYLTDDEDRIHLKRGESLHILPGMIHKFATLGTDAKILEASTPEIWDVVRHEDKYGRA